MGSTQFDSTSYTAATRSLNASGMSFKRQATAAATGQLNASSIADPLNPRKLNRAIHSQGARECCKVPGVNDVLSIAAWIDLTGSMGQFPYELQKDLPTIMQTLIDQGITEHPSILVGGMDDEIAVPPDACLQISQFETGSKELLDAINNIIIPSNGGGNRGESYHLAFYAMARHTYSQLWSEDQQKGIVFLICDEEPVIGDRDPSRFGTTPEIAKECFGDTLESEVPLLTSLKEVVERNHVFIIRPDRSSQPQITKKWQKLLKDAGENPENVIDGIKTTAEVITYMVLMIGQKLGHDVDDLADVLRTKGASIDAVTLSAVKAIVPVGGPSTAIQTTGTASGELATTDTAGRARR